MPRYCIQAAMFKLAIPFCDRFTHNFWILREIPNNKVISQLHGFATSRRSGEIVPIGYTSDHSLRAHYMIYDEYFASEYGLQTSAYALPIHDYKTVYDKEDGVERWLRAINAVEDINQLNLNYPRGGVSIPLSATVNSNSIYHTLAQVMEIPLHRFKKFVQIGINSSVKSVMSAG